MSFLRKVLADRLYLSAAGIGVVFVVCSAYIFGGVLDQPLTRRPDQVTVQLAAAGGLFEGAAVTYRGVKIGKVTEIGMGDSGVEATISLTSDDQVPKNSFAQVRSLSPVGEQYLDFQPRASEGPYLGDGDVVLASSTDIPKTLGSTVVALNDVLRQIDDRKVRDVLVELSTGLNGTGGDIGRIVDQGSAILEDLDRIWPETDRLITNADTSFDIVTDEADTIRQFGRSARQFSEFLRTYDPELQGLLRRAPDQLAEAEALVRDAQQVLPDFLDVGVSFSDIFVARDPQLRALLQNYQPGIGVLSNSVSGGFVQLQLIADKDPRCRYDIARRDPLDTQRRQLNADGACAAGLSFLQRGAAEAPGPR